MKRNRTSASETAKAQRALQAQTDQRDRARKHSLRSRDSAPPATGPREQPRNPMPRQHLAKPGLESSRVSR